MKILFIHHNSSKGGASNSLYHLLAELKKLNHELFVITPNGPVVNYLSTYADKVIVLKSGQIPNFFSAYGIPFIGIRMLSSFIKNYKVLFEIKKITSTINPDLVHLNDSGQVFVAKVLNKMSYPIIMQARTRQGTNPGSRVINRIVERMINLYVSRLLAINQSVAKSFKRVIDIQIIYNPYINPITPGIVKRKSEEFNCLFLANFLSFKGIFETIEAAIKLKGRRNIHFYIAGDNVRSSEFFDSVKGRILDWLGLYPNIKKWIQKKIRKHNLTNVHLLGYVDDLSGLLQNMHVSLAPMRLDAPPRSVFEVGSYGIPTILALKNTEESDAIENGVSGVIIEERDVTALVDAICQLEEDENLRLSLGQRAFENFKALHNPHKIAEQVNCIYESVLGNKQP